MLSPGWGARECGDAAAATGPMYISTMPSTSHPLSVVCPNCSAAADGRFCSSCGTPLPGTACAACDAPLVAGAKFCHRCGSPVGTGGPAPGTAVTAGRGLADLIPWAVAGVALVALVVTLLTQRRGAGDGAAGYAVAAETRGGAAPLTRMGVGGPRAPDISNLSPRERASRLFDRIMRYESEGQIDSIRFFAPMAISAYLMLDSLDLDARYDIGRIATAAGADSIALAQADSILRREPSHLLGLALGARAAHRLGKVTQARDLERRLIAAAPTEERRDLPEYQAHRAEIEAAVEAAIEAAKQTP